MGRERLEEITQRIPMLRRHQLTRTAVLVIYSAIAVLGLSIIFIAIAVGEDTEAIARVALALVLAGTIILILGIAVAGVSLAKSADAITYAVERTLSLGR
jgi:Zn-dependent protease with chaperone function